MSEDHNDLAFWFPKIKAAGLPVPSTEIVQTDVALHELLDGKTPDGWEDFRKQMWAAAHRIGGPGPVFMRTGHTSGKHSWDRCCYVPNTAYLDGHIGALVEYSAMADLMGLPTNTWAIRQLVPTTKICACWGYGGMPVVREFRFFATSLSFEHIQPYWPPDAVEQGQPDREDWRRALAEASALSPRETLDLSLLATDAVRAVGGGLWSVDFMQAFDGSWWLTDMAKGEDSFRYDPE